MVNNGTPQLLQEIFSLQANGAAAGRPASQAVQDKGRIKSALLAGVQPAPQPPNSRPTQSNKKSPRTQKSPKAKHNTVHLTLWVNPIVKEEVTTPSAFPDGFSGNAHSSESRCLPMAQSEPEDLSGCRMIPGE
jgi:hypothetical protein